MQRADIFFRGEQEQTLLFISIFIYYFLFLMRSHCQKAAQSAIETDGLRSNIGSVYCATPEARFFIFFGGDKQNTSHSYEPQTEKLKVQNMKKKKKKKITDQRSNAFSGRDGVMRVTRQNISNNQ